MVHIRDKNLYKSKRTGVLYQLVGIKEYKSKTENEGQMIIDHCRDEKELYDLYTLRPMPNQYEFEWLMRNPNLFCFYDEKQGFLRGFITVQIEDDLLTLSGTSIRGNMAENIQAIITVCNAFKDDMHAFTSLKHAGLVLKKAGFKRISKNKYVRYKNG